MGTGMGTGTGMGVGMGTGNLLKWGISKRGNLLKAWLILWSVQRN